MTPTSKRLHRLLDVLLETGQKDVVYAAEIVLRQLLNGAVALKHIRMYPRSSEEAVSRVLGKRVSGEGTGKHIR